MSNNFFINKSLILDKQILSLIEKKIKLIQNAKESSKNHYLELRQMVPDWHSRYVHSEFISEFFEKIYDEASQNVETKISFLGPNGTFTHQAALKIFGKSVVSMPQMTIFDIFNSVEKEQCDFGVVPVENSIEGSVNPTLDLLINSDLKIYGEKTINICHNLIGTGKLRDIKEIYSHPQILGQCRNWLQVNLPNAELIEMSSSTAAVQKIKKIKSKAAIGTLLAADIYQYPIIKKNIHDIKSNKTRFFILSREDRLPGKHNKTSLIFLCQDKPGILVETLKIFKQYNINLTKIESRPSKRRDWEYYFFLDLLGHKNDENIKNALKQLEKVTLFIKILGSYPVH